MAMPEVLRKGKSMKTLLTIVLFAACAKADSIPYYIYINSTTGAFKYSGLTLSGGGAVASGGSFTFSADGNPSTKGGRFSNGSLVTTGASFTLNGTLSHVWFNPKTGQLAADFVGQYLWAGGGMHVDHARFFEKMDMKNHSLISGYLQISNTPEPSSIYLMASGLAGIGALAKKWRSKG